MNRDAPGRLVRRVLLMAPQPFFEWRGSPIRVGFTAQALAELGYAVDLLVMPIGEPREIPGVRLFRAANPFGIRRLPIGPSIAKAALDTMLAAKAVSLGGRQRYDVVHGIEDAGLIAALVGRRLRAAVVFEKHSDPASYRGGMLRNLVLGAYAHVEAAAVRSADAVIGTSPGLVAQATRIRPDVAAHHIFDIPSSLTEAVGEDVRTVRQLLTGGEDRILITYVGSFAVYQGIDLMFESMPPILDAAPAARFVVIGGSPGEVATRRAWLEQRGLTDRVAFVGHVAPDRLPAYLRASDILLSPRLAGVNAPLKLLDYLKAGRAIVASDIEANRFVLDEESALLVEPTVPALVAGVRRLLDDAALRERLGRQGRTKIDTLYNFTEFRRRLGICYQALFRT